MSELVAALRSGRSSLMLDAAEQAADQIEWLLETAGAVVRGAVNHSANPDYVAVHRDAFTELRDALAAVNGTGDRNG